MCEKLHLGSRHIGGDGTLLLRPVLFNLPPGDLFPVLFHFPKFQTDANSSDKNTVYNKEQGFCIYSHFCVNLDMEFTLMVTVHGLYY